MQEPVVLTDISLSENFKSPSSRNWSNS